MGPIHGLCVGVLIYHLLYVGVWGIFPAKFQHCEDDENSGLKWVIIYLLAEGGLFHLSVIFKRSVKKHVLIAALMFCVTVCLTFGITFNELSICSLWYASAALVLAMMFTIAAMLRSQNPTAPPVIPQQLEGMRYERFIPAAHREEHEPGNQMA